MRSGNGRHRRPRQAPALLVAAGVTGAGIAIPLLGASGAQAVDASTWDRVAECESGGLWSANEDNGYYGGLQLTLEMWEQYGGTSYAERPDLASRSQQIAVGEKILAAKGPEAFPQCADIAGLGDGGSQPPQVDPGTDPSGDPGGYPAPGGGDLGDEPAPGPSDSWDSSDPSGLDPTDPGPSDRGPSDTPSDSPSGYPTDDPSDSPSGSPSDGPSDTPSESPSDGPSDGPSDAPTTPPDDSASPSTPGNGDEKGDDRGDGKGEGTGKHRGKPDEREHGQGQEQGGDGSAQGHRHGDEERGEHPSRGEDSREGEGGGKHRVRHGDSLSQIAADQDIRGGWTELYERNREVVGEDPDLIIPGQRLRY